MINAFLLVLVLSYINLSNSKGFTLDLKSYINTQ